MKKYVIDLDVATVADVVKKLLQDKKYIVVIDMRYGCLNLYRRTSKDTLFADMTWEQGLRWIRNMMEQDNDTHDEVVKILLVKNHD